MKQFFQKLLLGKVSIKDKPNVDPIQKRILNIQSIWNNDHQDDNGIEKIVRLFLSISQLLFPGVYIKYVLYKTKFEWQDLAMDIYILVKLSLPFFILLYQWQHFSLMIALMVYFLVETILYIPTLIFASDMLSRPRSYKRSMLYSCGNNMNIPFTTWYDPIYFSIVTSSSIGFGDYYPVTMFAKALVSVQALFFLTFVVLFLNFFSTKLKSKGYFDHESDN
jgi:voltage-gated potassium channel